ncbi:Grap2 and cyclin-D-interacting-domain-containing protein [Fimicolochytrium jonesii]|uniref:Grap2 and cyclin-D-interacting-domain-containing protein n=1 Tax=Fimicolochytrium jonesii TaxID=1396493 RepID=UPI0022FE5E67|nr:Grap2 and cyclin-D-interacting-domain-containing protein [Fimicolochytrium jonesii]KAI8819418.1 Grap2 and cyclin-D-interacting-domain-containing protein [Fimicolochytrium jonesii]
MTTPPTPSTPAPNFDVDLATLIDLALHLSQELQKRDTTSGLPLKEFDQRWFETETKNTVKLLSHNATKLSLIAPEKSRDTPKVTSEIHKCLLHLSALIDSVPGSLGSVLQDEIRSTVSLLFTDVASLANNFLTTPRELKTGSNSIGYASSTGLVWKTCEVVEGMAFRNGEAVARRVRDRLGLVEDAIEEDEGDDADGDAEDEGGRQFTPSEKELANQCLVIMKATKLLLKKVIVAVQNEEQPSASKTPPTTTTRTESEALLTERTLIQDTLARVSLETSHRVDDLALLIEPPLHASEVAAAASALAQTCASVMEAVKTLVEDEKTLSWFETCGAQVGRVLERILERDSAR